jgi:hypothetical protein
MVGYLEHVRAESDRVTAARDAAREAEICGVRTKWAERLMPLEDRLKKLLSEMPEEVIAQGLSLASLRRLLAGKWRGNCHPGELGEALRNLHFIRRRSWSDDEGFKAKWYRSVISTK